MPTFKEQIVAELKEEGVYKRGQTYDAVLNPPPDADDDEDEAEDSIDIRPLDEVLAMAQRGDVVDVYVYAKPSTAEWDGSLVTTLLVTLT
jgi:hypothetical protein